MTDSRFRLLLVIGILLSLASLVAMTIPGAHPAALEEAILNEPDYWSLLPDWLLLCVLFTLLVAMLVGLVGLFRLRYWGRTLSLYTTIAGFFLVASSGPVIESGLAAAIGDVSLMLWGAILACAYFSPVSTKFSARRPEH